MPVRLVAVLALAIAGFNADAWAANYTWVNATTGGLWSNNANWSSAPTFDDTAVLDFSTLDITADNTTSMDGSYTANSLIFGDSATATAGSWAIDNNGNSANVLTLAGATPTITTNALGTGKSATISANITSASGFTVTGAGSLSITGQLLTSGAVVTKTTGQTGSLSISNTNNNFSLIGTSSNAIMGTTTVSGGTVTLGAAGAALNVGRNAAGSLSLVNSVSASTPAATDLLVGYNDGANATYSTSLTLGTSASHSASLSVGRDLAVGRSPSTTANVGTATATINTSGTLTIGRNLSVGWSSGNNTRLGATFTLTNGTVDITGNATVTNTPDSGAATAQKSANITATGGTLTIGGNSTLNSNASGAVNFNARTVVAVNGASGITLSGAGTQNLRIDSGGQLSVQGITLSGSSSILHLGAAATSGTLRALANNSTFITGATGTLSVYTGSIVINSNGFDIGIAKSFNNAASNTGRLTKAGAGTLTLSGANTYSGTTTIAGGMLALDNASALGGGGSLRFTGGALRYGTNNTVDYSARIKSSGSAVAIDTNSQVVTFGTAVDATNTGGLTKSGAGTLRLSVANAYTGTTSVTAGTLLLGDSLAIQSSVFDTSGAGDLSFGSLTAATFAGLGGSGGLVLSNTDGSPVILTIGGNAGATTLSGTLGGAGSLVKTGSGTLTLAGNNTYAGPTTVSAGALVIGSTASLPRWDTFGSWSVASGATLGVNNSVDDSAIATLVATGNFSAGSLLGVDTSAGDRTIASVLAGSPGLWKGGLNTLALTATNTYSGTTVVAAGRLLIGSTDSLPGWDTIGRWSVASGATLGVTNSVDDTAIGTLVATNNFTAGSLLGLDTSAGDRTLSSALAGAQGLSKDGGGTLVVSAANTYTGPTAVTSGTLSVSADSNLGTAPGSATPDRIVINGGVLAASAGFALDQNRGIAVGPASSAGTGTIDVASGTLSYAGIVANSTSGTGSLMKTGPGTLSLSGSNTYSGSTTVGGGVLALDGAGALGGGGNITFAGGVLQFSANNTVNYAARIKNSTTGAISLDTNGVNVAFSSGIDASNTMGLTKTGDGVLTLSGSNGYTGTTAINQGTLSITNAAALGGGGSVTFNGGWLRTGNAAGAGIDLGGRIVNSGSAIRVNTWGSSPSYGAIDSSNVGGFEKNGNGTLTFTASNGYLGTTTVMLGVLALGINDAISDLGDLVVSGGGFNLAGFNDTVATVTLTSGSIFGSGTLTAATYALQGGAVGGALGTGAIAVSTGTTTLGSAGRLNAASGLTISSGQLTLGGDESVASFVLAGGALAGSGNSLTSGSTYDVRSGSVFAILGGGAGLTKSTAGSVTLSGSNSYTGDTIIKGGTLALGAGGSFANSARIVVGDSGSSGAVLDLTQSGSLAIGPGQVLQGRGRVLLDGLTDLTVLGLFSPGNSPDLFTYDGGGTVTLSGTTLMEIWGTARGANPGYDAVDVINGTALTLGGALVLDFSQNYATDASFLLFDTATSGTLASGFTGITITGSNTDYTSLTFAQSGNVWTTDATPGGQALQVTQTGSQVTLLVITVAVPEPGTLALAGIALAAAGWTLRRRGRRHA